mgnify:CR=1 FL=1|tara:strand:- start:14579 stop:15304 length:726 start_codon:yes stop_codon:yes gene_type:complete
MDIQPPQHAPLTEEDHAPLPLDLEHYGQITVELIQSYGDDQTPVKAARVSTASDLRAPDVDRDVKLTRYLLRHGHTSPFEHLGATFMLKCPLFVARQIMRHRTFSYNEMSRRYTDAEIEIYQFPTLYTQHESALQCSDETEPLTGAGYLKEQIAQSYKDQYVLYHYLLRRGVAREQARAVLPQATMTRFYMTGNLHNWLRFIKLRNTEHAQYEARLIAQKISALLSAQFPTTMMIAQEEIL